MKHLFSVRIKELREREKLTQIEFAAILNVTKQTVSAWEKNIQATDFDMLVTIARHFNVSADYLLGLED